MKALLIDADSKIPNIALGKISTWLKQKGYKVDFYRLGINYYKTNNQYYDFTGFDYDVKYCSMIYPSTRQYINTDGLICGGTGYDIKKTLDDEIESMDVDYSLYPENKTSWGFITRGCIRNCSFCFVPEKEGNIHLVSSIDVIVKHKKVQFLDNNILAYEKHIDILKELKDKKIKCRFSQGLDIRLLTKENSNLLSELNYFGDYTFAFDDIRYMDLINKKIELLKWRKPYQIKFYIYVSDKMKICDTVDRIAWCKKNQFLPYVMRDINCYNSDINYFYTDLAAWCNQPALFKKMDFNEFLKIRHSNKNRIEKSMMAALR